MQKRRRVVLFGTSLVVSTVGESLRRSGSCEVISLSMELQHSQELRELVPDIVLFDLEAARPEAAFALLESCAGVRLIGISPDSNLVRIWSGRQLRELSTLDLMEIINM